MFDESFYLELVNGEFGKAPAAPLTTASLTSRAPRTLVRLKECVAKDPLKGGSKFSHYRPARFMAEKVATLTMPAATLDRFEAAFKAVNLLLP
jgi:hypothetical protein